MIGCTSYYKFAQQKVKLQNKKNLIVQILNYQNFWNTPRLTGSELAAGSAITPHTQLWAKAWKLPNSNQLAVS